MKAKSIGIKSSRLLTSLFYGYKVKQFQNMIISFLFNLGGASAQMFPPTLRPWLKLTKRNHDIHVRPNTVSIETSKQLVRCDVDHRVCHPGCYSAT